MTGAARTNPTMPLLAVVSGADWRTARPVDFEALRPVDVVVLEHLVGQGSQGGQSSAADLTAAVGSQITRIHQQLPDVSFGLNLHSVPVDSESMLGQLFGASHSDPKPAEPIPPAITFLWGDLEALSEFCRNPDCQFVTWVLRDENLELSNPQQLSALAALSERLKQLYIELPVKQYAASYQTAQDLCANLPHASLAVELSDAPAAPIAASQPPDPSQQLARAVTKAVFAMSHHAELLSVRLSADPSEAVPSEAADQIAAVHQARQVCFAVPADPAATPAPAS